MKYKLKKEIKLSFINVVIEVFFKKSVTEHEE